MGEDVSLITRASSLLRGLGLDLHLEAVGHSREEVGSVKLFPRLWTTQHDRGRNVTRRLVQHGNMMKSGSSPVANQGLAVSSSSLPPLVGAGSGFLSSSLSSPPRLGRGFFEQDAEDVEALLLPRGLLATEETPTAAAAGIRRVFSCTMGSCTELAN